MNNYLEHLVHENTVIYQFNPDAIRKIDNIIPISEKFKKFSTWTQKRNKIVMLMHDQEPLGLDTYDDFTVDGLSTLLKKLDISILDNFKDRLFQEYRHLGPMILNFICFSVYDKILLSHSELDSLVLKDYEKLGVVGVYWWSHALIARDWYRYARIDPTLDFSDKTYQIDFNIYNRSWTGTREYRLKFTELILQKNLIKDSRIKFSPFDGSIHYKQHQFKNNKFRVESDLEILPINIVSACQSADYSSDDYNECGIDVVLETLFDDLRKHLTEKILRPIACGKPFILVSTPGSLEYLKTYGFNTFSTIIDESYDTIKDPIERLEAITNLMKNISNLSKEKKDKIFREMHQIAKENKRKFWSDIFAENIKNEFIKNYTSAYDELQKYKQGRNWIELRKKVKSWNPMIDWTQETNLRSRKDLLSIHKELHLNRRLSI